MSKRGGEYKVILERQNADLVQTLGTLHVVNEEDRIQFSCWALELPDRGNKRSVSRIPAETYKLVKRWSQKYGDHFHVLDVEDRSMILIHSGNTYKDTRGCILVGNDLGYINQDEHLDVLNSKDTMNKLLSLLPESTTIMIVENESEEDDSELIKIEKK